jgi:hypothetical protein
MDELARLAELVATRSLGLPLPAAPFPPLALGARLAVRRALRVPLGNQLDTSLDHLGPRLRDVVQEDFPLGAVEAVDVSEDDQVRASPARSGGRLVSLAGTVPPIAERSACDQRRQVAEGGGRASV